MTRRTWIAPGTMAGRVAGQPHRGTPKLLWRLGFGISLAVQMIVIYSPRGVGGIPIPGLDKVVYHGKLGSQGDRAERVRAIGHTIVNQLRLATLPYTVDAKAGFDVLDSKVQ